MTAPSVQPLLRHRLELVLPDGFAVVAAVDRVAVHPVDPGSLDAPARAWLDEVEAARVSSEALLVAVYTEPWRGGTTVGALSVSMQVLEDPRDVALEVLWRDALESTSTAGLVRHLTLPQGPAVGTTDVAELHGPHTDAEPAAVGLVEVHLPLPTAGVLVSLSLTTPQPELLAVYAGMTRHIAGGVRVHAVADHATRG